MAASRLQRWAILLAGYDYEIEYVSSKKNCADALSRLPQGRQLNKGAEVTYLNFVEDFLPITNSEVRKQTAKDILLSRILLYVQSGWPLSCPDEQVKPYFMRRNELYVECGCLMWGYRMIIPVALRKYVLKQLHTSHMGIVKTKSLARSYVWWPNIDSDVEAVCQSCETCAIEGSAPPHAPPQPWPYSTQPWSRLHMDFLGPYRGSTFMVLIDASSKWLEVFDMPRTNATQVIKVLRSTFSRFGLPLELVSDQGPPFTSMEVSSFLKNNGIRQSFSPAYHPSSNGAAENAVKMCKSAIKKAYRDNLDIDTALQSFLLNYRNTVQSSTGETPAMLLQRRALRSRLDLLRADRAVEDRVRTAQQRQVQNKGGVIRELAPQDTVWSRNCGKGDKWMKGIIQARAGTREYLVDNGDGRFIRKHIDHIKRRSRLSDFACSDSTTLDQSLPTPDQVTDVEDAVPAPEVVVDVSESDRLREGGDDTVNDKEQIISTSEHPPSPLESRSRRTRRPVTRFQVQ